MNISQSMLSIQKLEESFDNFKENKWIQIKIKISQ